MSKTVTYRIVRISPLRTARIAAVMWMLAGVPYAFFAQFPRWLPFGYQGWIMVLYPLLYGLLGFVVTLAGAAVYNLVGPRVGGFVYTVRMPMPVAQQTEGSTS